MAGLVGMDIEAVRHIARQLGQQATDLQAIGQAVDRIVAELRSVWRGTDAETFENWWAHKHKPALNGCGSAVLGLAQSALNNATEQEGVSGGLSGTTSPAAGPSVSPGHPVTDSAVSANVTPSGRSWQEVQAGYDSWAKGYWAQDGQYQCTAWARYRWHELNVDLPDVALGNGWQMADGVARVTGVPVSTQPSLHAIASYGDGSGANHVMVVEEIKPDGTVRFSEMNTGSDGSKWYEANPQEYMDTREIKPNADGTYSYKGYQIRFAAIPK